MSQRNVDGILIVDCKGRIIFGEESARLRDTLHGLIVKDGRIILNLTGMNHMDSGGLGTLVALFNSARATGAAIKMAGLNPRMRDLLEITRLTSFFDVADTVEDALQEFRKDAPQ